MAEKSEDQIQRDKEAVAKMHGAKSAMESALRRIASLEEAGKKMAVLHHEAVSILSENALVSTKYSDADSMGRYVGDSKIVPVKHLTRQINRIKSEIFDA